MLRLQQKTISPETISAMAAVSQLVAILAKKYKLIEQGKIEL
jgi:hypothetical protein